MMNNKIFIQFFFHFFIATPLISQIQVSRQTVNLGDLSYGQESISIPVINQCSNEITLFAQKNEAGLQVHFPEKIQSYETNSIVISGNQIGSGKFNQTIWFQIGTTSTSIDITGNFKNSDNLDCYDFKDKKPKNSAQVKNHPKNYDIGTIRLFEDEKQLIAADIDKIPYAHMVILLDVSGSMGEKDKLDEMKTALITLINQLRPYDLVSILTYREKSEIIINKKSCSDKQDIYDSISNIRAGGFTNGKEGIESALEFTKNNRTARRSNQIIMLTDGAFNLGDDHKQIEGYLKFESKKMNYKLSVLSVQEDGEQSALLKSLSKAGNGYYFDLPGGSPDIEYLNRILIKQLSI